MDEEKVINTAEDEVEVSEDAFAPAEDIVVEEVSEKPVDQPLETATSVIPEEVISEFETDPEYNVEVDMSAIEEDEDEETSLSEDTKAEMKKKFLLWQKAKDKKKSKLYKAIGVGSALVLGGIAIGLYLSGRDND